VVFLLMTAIDLADQRRAPAVVAAVVAAAGVQGVALGQRRRHPVAVTALVALADAVVLVAAPASVLPVGTWLALGPLAVARPPRVSLAGLVAASAVSAISFTTQQAEDPVFAIVVGVAVWALGEAIRSSRDASRQEALRAVAEERAHLEREIHDVLAHSLSLSAHFRARPNARSESPPNHRFSGSP
jgi:signal transduction histidine kinase